MLRASLWIAAFFALVAADAADPDYLAGKEALARKDWPEAIKALGRVGLREPDNADVQQLLGYAWHGTGKFNVAFKHYERALALDPRHKEAHGHIGEAFVRVGNLASAEKHLAELRTLCPLGCEPLTELERAIAEYGKRK